MCALIFIGNFSHAKAVRCLLKANQAAFLFRIHSPLESLFDWTCWPGFTYAVTSSISVSFVLMKSCVYCIFLIHFVSFKFISNPTFLELCASCWRTHYKSSGLLANMTQLSANTRCVNRFPSMLMPPLNRIFRKRLSSHFGGLLYSYWCGIFQTAFWYHQCFSY